MAFCAALLVSGADRPRATLLTGLPLVWGEGDASDVLAGRAKRSATLATVEQSIDVRVVDVITTENLGRDIAIIAQPRRLSPAELVAFDGWVRAGGRALVFADPDLVWPSRYALGDNRRPPPVMLLDPLLDHWGITLGDSDQKATVRTIGGMTIATVGAGAWQGPKSCRSIDPLVLDCKIGRGRAILVGDADLLDERVWQAANIDNPDWAAALVRDLAGQRTSDSNRSVNLPVAAAILAASLGSVALFVIISRKFLRT